jgi:hypothetical protein
MRFATTNDYLRPLWHMMNRKNYYDILDPLLVLDTTEDMWWTMEDNLKEMNIENSVINGYPFRGEG